MNNQISDLEKKLYQEESPEIDHRRFLDKMTDWYFKPKSFEKSGKNYEALGVRRFKKFVYRGDYINAYLRKHSDADVRLIKNKNSAKIF